jgi:prepilin-type N-terminal cleavage/methylation domain-containing protein
MGGCKPNRRAFTLIELLVVIAVIAIMAAVLFPVFAKAKEHTRKTRCRNNMHQIIIAIRMYLDDHDGFMCPYDDDAHESADSGHAFGYCTYLLKPYYKDKGIWVCPSGHQRYQGWDTRNYWWGFWPERMTWTDPRTGEVYFTNYEIGFDSQRGNTLSGHNLYMDYGPEGKVQLVMDYPCNWGANQDSSTRQIWEREVVKLARRSHRDGCLVGKLDGHVEWWQDKWEYNVFVGYQGG